MKDLRFVFYTEEETEASSEIRDNKELVELISEFNNEGKAYNQKYSLIQNSKLQAKFEKKKRSDFPGRWSVFKAHFLKFTKHKCPICSADIQRYSHIDHFRPKNEYWWLSYEYENYQILCSDCNSAYKGVKFPLLDDNKKVTLQTFTKISEIDEVEKPLLINPFTDNAIEYFVIQIYQKLNIVKIVPKNTNTVSYEYKKADTTIKTYNLDDSRDDEKSDRNYLFRSIFHPITQFAKARTLFTSNKTLANYVKYKTIKGKTIHTLSGSWIEFIENDNYVFI